MAPPGSLEARYEQLAGPKLQRRELYLARKEFHYGIAEWLALPWWQRRLYLEQRGDEVAQAREAAESAGDGGAAAGGDDLLGALYSDDPWGT